MSIITALNIRFISVMIFVITIILIIMTHLLNHTCLIVSEGQMCVFG